IQPTIPRQDNWLEAGVGADDNPLLYTIGCAGRIEQCDPQPDGRFVILLKGVRRFRVREELPLSRGYRRVAADYGEFTGDLLDLETALDPARMINAVRTFSEKHGLSFDWDVLGSLPGVSLLNGLAVALPFRPEEKQALLEAAGLAEREELLLTLMGMGIEPLEPDDYYTPPILN
ncbi:MAG TPA: LON peptidase substrate-binding domain-containing protein, partial [Thermoanaerobaculia bacterium]